MTPDFIRIRISIRGAVQGVGFRPFVYRLATSLGLTGWVSNSTEGVWIEAEGRKPVLDEFLIRLNQEPPQRASIHSLEYSFLDSCGFTSFEIRNSQESGSKRTVILPDIATCPDCLREMFDPLDRRYQYPFINCTNCGPRFTIIERLPYDRPNTTMRHFTMCPQCRSEYENPADRRFHAQPNACPDCGPRLEIWDDTGMRIADQQDAIPRAVEALKEGRIVAVKGLGGFHLLVDAANENAVVRLRLLKRREQKPFAVMAPSLEFARSLCRLDALEERALTAPESPIVLLLRKRSAAIAPSVAPKNPYLGLMLPYTPIHHLLLRAFDKPLVATSGNRSEEPIAIDEGDALRRLFGIADLFLVHNRAIRRHADDSIVRILLGREQVLRRARGYAPLPVALKAEKGRDAEVSALSIGGHLKNTVALTVGADVFVSQHIGDLETKESFYAFRQAIEDFENLYEAHPDVVGGDMHPDYLSARYGADLADSKNLPFERIQHHWAHVLSCMADNEVGSPALGVAWDGTGYGSDAIVWGGEFLLADGDGFRREAHFRTFPLPGGDAAVKRPKHTAKALLYEILGSESFNGTESPILRQMLEKRIRCPRTSSVGRLFDAVSSIVGICDEPGFEGQAAMELEFAVSAGVTDSYEYAIRSGYPLVVDWEAMVRQILSDVKAGTDRGIIAARFHNSLARIVVDVAHRVGQNRVVLTGGCFQNRYLTERTVEALRHAGFSVYWHQRVPPNDGGLALGQAVAIRNRILSLRENAAPREARAG
jgi:hydrogenase maturation protein HypF